VPALDTESVRQTFDRDGLGDIGIFLRAAERVRVHECEVIEIAQVVDDQQVIGSVVEIGGNALPPRILKVGDVENLRRIGECRIAHPDPDDVLLLDDGIALHAELRRDAVLAGNLHAFAGRVELQPVIHAAHTIALDAALRQLGAAVTAAIVQCNDLPALATVEDDRLAQQAPLEQLAVHDLVVPAAHVPAVLQKHLTSPIAPARRAPGVARKAGSMHGF
jgi:hypothetical protein